MVLFEGDSFRPFIDDQRGGRLRIEQVAGDESAIGGQVRGLGCVSVENDLDPGLAETVRDGEAGALGGSGDESGAAGEGEGFRTGVESVEHGDRAKIALSGPVAATYPYRSRARAVGWVASGSPSLVPRTLTMKRKSGWTCTMVAVAFLSVSVVAAEPPRTALPAYWIATMTVTNPEAFAKEFMPVVTKVFAGHGGKYLARGGRVMSLEGTPARRVVILEFPSVEAAQAAYASPVYKDARKIGDRYATFESIVVVEALAPAAHP